MTTRKLDGWTQTYALADGREITEYLASGEVADAPDGMVSVGEVVDETDQYDAGQLAEIGERIGGQVVKVYACYDLEVDA